ncbi:outer membrane protein assembly factor BamB [Moraxella ovis]|uniref:outer membrane protein assembly factor BamB n=1 Tax=Moraxella ovis TaxID=29433 RepID=UPI000D84035D|nr:outer membrane protein assembly factor BamB [Moraxella ovis]SPX85902.1 Lipoprotein yfgL precursor [Moraxella ovis]STZ06848.1 Lipoprotein yfgL precursor [Moraxella ovis]
MHTRFVKTALVCALSAVALVGCGKGIKAESKKPAKLIKISAPVAVLSPVFSASLDQGRSMMKGSRASKKDVVDLQVAQTGEGLIAASRGGIVALLNGKQTVWSVDLKEAITSGVSSNQSGSVAIVGTRSGKVVAINAQTGAIVWEKALPTSSPTPALITNNRVLLSGNNGTLYGLDLQTGTAMWQFSTQNVDVSVRGAAKPLHLDEQTALFGTADGRIHAINPASGTPLWTRRVGMATGGSAVERMSDVDGTPLVVGQHLYVTSFSGQLAAFNMSTGRPMFVGEIPSTKSPTVLGEVLVATGVNGDVKAFNRLTGETLWLNENLKHRKLTNPVTVGNYIAVGDYDGVIHLFDVNGNIVSRVDTKGQLTSLQVNGNRLYAQSASGVVSVWQF